MDQKPNDQSDKVEDEPIIGLASEEFKEAATAMIEYIMNYRESLKTRKTLSSVQPGFMRNLLPKEAPKQKENWKKVFADIDQVIMNGTLHWQSANFVAYFPAGCSYPDQLAELLISSICAIGFSWASCPSLTELELEVMDWLARALNLPKCFIYGENGVGGGCIQNSASECTLVSLLAARSKMIRDRLAVHKDETKHSILSRLVAYTSKYAHSSVQRAGDIGVVEMKLLDVDEDISLRGETLQKQIEQDRKEGKIPFYVCATLGTTSCTSHDNLPEIGEVCRREGIWFHIDAAYSGSALICPEFQHYGKGIELATSFSFNCHKNLLVGFPTAAYWVSNVSYMTESFNVNPVYLQHDNQSKIIDYRHWQLGLGKRFNSIKLWFVLRMIGIEGLQAHVRGGYKRAKYLETLVREHSDYELLFQITLGLVCFRFHPKGVDDEEKLNEMNEQLPRMINDDGRIHVTGSLVEGKRFIRLCTSSALTTKDTIDQCWEIFQEFGKKIHGPERV